MNARRLNSPALVLLSGTVVLAMVALRMLLDSSGLSVPTGDLLELRSVRVLTGLTVGAALGVSGAVMQSLLRNPLAAPDLLGVASGSGLAVMVTALISAQWGVPFGMLAPTAALAGALLTLGILYGLASRRGELSVIGLTLIGVAIGFMFGAAGRLIEHLLADRGIAANRWMMGSLRDDLPVGAIAAAGVVTLVGTAVATVRARAMDVCTLGDDAARTMGVALGPHRAVLFLVSGTLAAVSVYLAGPVGFVGLIAPHVVRLAGGPGHRTLIPVSGLVGAALVVGADCVVRGLVLSSGRVPIGVVTSLIGGPLLIAMLRRGVRPG